MGYIGYVAPIPIGEGGLDSSENLTGPAANRLIKAINVEISNTDHLIQKEGGSSHANATVLSGTPAINGGSEYWPDSSNQKLIIATSAGDLLLDDLSYTFATTLKSGLGADKLTTFVQCGAESTSDDIKIISFNGYDLPQVLKSSSLTATTDISAPPADWTGTSHPVKGCLHNLRLWAGMGHFLYASMTDDNEDFTTTPGSLLFNVYPSEGSEITNMVSLLGRLFIFKKPSGIYYLDESASSSSSWLVKKITSRFGCCGPNALDSGKNEVVFVSNDGNLHYLSGIQEFGDVKESDIISVLNLNNLIRDDINKGRLDRCVVRYNEDKRTIFIAYTSKGGTRNDRILKLNIADMNNIKATFTTKDECESMWVLTDPTSRIGSIQLGGNAGFIWKTDQLNKNVNGVAYTAEFRTPFTDYSWLDKTLANKNKIYDWLTVELIPLGNYNLSVSHYIDGEWIQNLVFNQSGLGSTLDAFELDSVTDGVLGGSSSILKKLPLYGSGITHSLQFYNSGLNQNFKIVKAYVGFRVGGEDLRE